jgi:hypothetical protein
MIRRVIARDRTSGRDARINWSDGSDSGERAQFRVDPSTFQRISAGGNDREIGDMAESAPEANEPRLGLPISGAFVRAVVAA